MMRYARLMATKTIGFAIEEKDLPRLDRLTKRFAGGNRSAFLREAMRQMEVVERAERLAKLQAYGAERASETGVSQEQAVEIVRRVLKKH
jgi:Arc/MetJ-type ribon-helix-helix transcriptional regulator